MSGSVSRRRIHEGGRSRTQGRGRSRSQFPDVNSVLPRIGAENPFIRRVGLHLVRVPIWPLMSTDRETPRRRVGGLLRPNVIDIQLLKDRSTKRAILRNGEHLEVAP